MERLISGVTKLTKEQDVENLTKSRGQDQSLTDVFSTIEEIKDTYIVDTLYGKYIEAIFNPPIVLVFTNERLDEHKSKLSEDRWLRLHINSNFSIKFRKDNGNGTITPLSLDRLNIKKIV